LPVYFNPEQEGFGARHILSRLRSWSNSLSLSTRLLLGIGMVIFTFTAVIVAWDIYDIRREAEKEMLHRSRLVTQELIALRAVIAQNQEKINTDPVTGNVQFKHLNPASVGRQVATVFNEATQFSLKQTRLNVRNPANEPDPTEVIMLQELVDSPRLSEIWREEFQREGWYFRYMIPIYTEESCLSCHGDPAGAKDISGYPMEGLKLGTMAGAISLGMPMEGYQKALQLRIWGRIVIAFGFFLATRWIIARLTGRLMAQPLRRLADMARRLGEGDWEAVRPVSGAGEIRVLSQILEQVAQQLKESHYTLEEKVKGRTIELSEANEELERVSRFKSEVLANVSHELRTPLTAIIAFTEMLLNPANGQLNQKQREYLEDITDSSRQLLMEVSDLLLMARFEAGKLELALEPFEMVELISDSISRLQTLAEKKNIQLLFPSAGGEWWVLADRAKVRHVLNNLLNNAVKFTPEGGRIAISLDRSPCNDSERSHGPKPEFKDQPETGYEGGMECLVVSVTDNGIGIDPRDQEVIFEKFYQLGRPEQGAGLGLAIAKELVLIHGGEIWVESEPGCGSAFHFALPLREQML